MVDVDVFGVVVVVSDDDGGGDLSLLLSSLKNRFEYRAVVVW